jgi:hypothetical protein
MSPLWGVDWWWEVILSYLKKGRGSYWSSLLTFIKLNIVTVQWGAH